MFGYKQAEWIVPFRREQEYRDELCSGVAGAQDSFYWKVHLEDSRGIPSF